MPFITRPLVWGSGLALVIGLALGLNIARPWESGDTIHAEPSATDPTVTLTYDQKGVDQAAARASLAVGFPVAPPDASAIGLTVKAVRIDPIRNDIPGRPEINPRRAVAIYMDDSVDPRALPAVPPGLSMQIAFLGGRWEATPNVDSAGKPTESFEELAFDVPGYTLIRVTSFEAPDTGALYYLIADEFSFNVRVGYENPQPGDRRPSDEQMMPILRSLALFK
jgi:hypothetical protein